jgi:hypothetical protein
MMSIHYRPCFTPGPNYTCWFYLKSSPFICAYLMTMSVAQTIQHIEGITSWKEYGTKQSWPNFMCYSGAYLGGLRKSTKTFSQYSWSSGRVLNCGSLDYEVGMLPFDRGFHTKSLYEPLHRNWGSSVSVVSDYLTTDWMTGVRSRQTQMVFPRGSVPRPALRFTQPPIQWVPGSHPRGKARPGPDVGHSSHLVPRSGMSMRHIPSPHWRLHGDSGTTLLNFHTRCINCRSFR